MRIRMISRISPVVLLLACSSPLDHTGSDAADGSVVGDGGAQPDAVVEAGAESGADAPPVMGAYPSGPYGKAAGDVIANFTWQGYVTEGDAIATTKAYGSYSLDDARKSGRKYAMINLSESLCPGCQKSAGELAADGKATYDAGGIVIEVLCTTGFVTQPTKSDLDAWINKYKLPVTTVKDPDGTGTATLTALGQREQAYIVDLATMKIVKVISGSLTGMTDTSAKLGMLELHKLLGK